MRLGEQAYHLIKEKIITLELEPLSIIDEKALSEDLELGRTPIREALQRLAGENLVFIAPRRGMFVAEISITDLNISLQEREGAKRDYIRSIENYWESYYRLREVTLYDFEFKQKIYYTNPMLTSE